MQLCLLILFDHNRLILAIVVDLMWLSIVIIIGRIRLYVLDLSCCTIVGKHFFLDGRLAKISFGLSLLGACTGP